LNHADITDISVSFVAEAYPRKLFEYLRDVYGYEVKEKWPGIYHSAGPAHWFAGGNPAGLRSKSTGE
jgi:hypothetical protein